MPAKTLHKKADKPVDLRPEFLATLRWLSPRQAAAYLQMSRTTLVGLQYEAERGESTHPIPFSRLSPRVIRYDRLALDAWAAGTVATSK